MACSTLLSGAEVITSQSSPSRQLNSRISPRVWVYCTRAKEIDWCASPDLATLPQIYSSTQSGVAPKIAPEFQPSSFYPLQPRS